MTYSLQRAFPGIPAAAPGGYAGSLASLEGHRPDAGIDHARQGYAIVAQRGARATTVFYDPRGNALAFGAFADGAMLSAQGSSSTRTGHE